MTDGGNAYTWGYVDHIINVDLDSSRYVKSSASVPFIGAVLHGYVEFAGTPFNEEGDTDYAILRAIENGAGLYFILSYQNTNELKEDMFLSQYYSVRYDIWREDIVNYYNKLNEQLRDVQTKVIVEHSFLEGVRVLDEQELLDEIEQALQNAIKEELEKQEAIKNEQIVAVGDAWNSALNAKSDIEALIKAMNAKNDEILNAYNRVKSLVSPAGVMNPFNTALDVIAPEVNPDNDPNVNLSGVDMTPHQKTALEAMQNHINSIKTTAAKVYVLYNEQKQLLQDVYGVIDTVKAASDVIEKSDLSAEVKKNLKEYMAQCLAEAEPLIANAEALVDVHVNLMADSNPEAVTKIAVTVKNSVDALTTVYGAWVPILPYIKEAYKDCVYFTEQDVLNAVQTGGGSQGGQDGKDEEIYDKYHVDNNKIVVVTYGDRDDVTGDKTPYKTFILNYNTYAVVVEYENVKYTIPAGGFVVLYK